jgi:hypothetical protein
MSISETKRKPGRPKGSGKKSRSKPKDVLTKEPIKETAPTKEEVLGEESQDSKDVKKLLVEAEAAAKEILEKDEKPSMMLQSEPDLLGNKAQTNVNDDPGVADRIPGTRPKDVLDIPDRVYDEISGVDRPCALKGTYHYCWVEGSKINWFKVRSYRFVLYDGGSRSGLAGRGFAGTNMFERTLDNHVRHGDIFLMYTDIRTWEDIREEDRKKLESWNKMPSGGLHNEGYGRGVRTFEEVDGQHIYN